MLLIINGGIYGFPLLSLEQRFFYWSDHPHSWFLSKVLSLFSYAGTVSGFMYATKMMTSDFKGANAILILAVSLVVISILYSNKFSWFLVFFVSYISGYISASYYYKGYSIRGVGTKLLVWVPVGAVFLIASVLFSYKYIHGYANDELLGKILARILQMQGQLWWATDYLVLNGVEGHPSRIIHRGSVESPPGIFQIMEFVMPQQSFEAYFSNKVPMTGGFPATIIFNVSIGWSIALIALCGIIMGLVIELLWRSTARGQILSVLVMVLYAMIHWTFTTGSMNILVSPFFLVITLTCFIYIFLKSLS